MKRKSIVLMIKKIIKIFVKCLIKQNQFKKQLSLIIKIFKESQTIKALRLPLVQII